MRFIASLRFTLNDYFLFRDVLKFYDRIFLLKPLLSKGLRRKDNCYHKAFIPMPLLRQRNLIILYFKYLHIVVIRNEPLNLLHLKTIY